MWKKLIVLTLAAAMLLSMTACGNEKKEEEEKAKAAAEEQAKKDAENEKKANEVIDAIQSLPANIRLKDKASVASARALYDGLTDEQKTIVPEDTLKLLEDAEDKLVELKEKRKKLRKQRAANRKAAAEVTAAIEQLPATVTLANKTSVQNARYLYNQLTPKQKKLVDKSSLNKLGKAEKRIERIEQQKQKKAQKKAQKKQQKKQKKQQPKKKKQQNDKYAIAKTFIRKKASALIARIGAPSRKKKNPNCSTDGEEWIYYYNGFYVGVLSQTMDSPLMVVSVTKN